VIGYLHGFLGAPEVWGDVEGIRLAMPPIAEAWGAQLAAIAERLGPVDAVVGYSLGARLALGLVVEGYAPRAVLISVNPGIADAERPARRAADAAWAKRFRSEPLADVLDAWEAQPLFAGRSRADRRARRLALDPEQCAQSLEVLGLAEMPDYRGAVDDRFRLIAGADDVKFVAIARALPAPLEMIAGSGHDPTLDQPAALRAAIERALTP
jgi:2-succinyl-6-hydroxy-2,4-cyclohexadiene-1-carboxylate synthase